MAASLVNESYSARTFPWYSNQRLSKLLHYDQPAHAMTGVRTGLAQAAARNQDSYLGGRKRPPEGTRYVD